MAEECATPVALNLVSKLGEYLFAPIGRQFGYVLCFKSYVEDLKKGVEELETALERVQHSVEEAKNNGKPIEIDIENWLNSAENKAEEARNLLKHGHRAKDACLHGWLPNPVVRHPIGRKVKKMTQVILVLHDKSENSNFQKVFYEKTPIGFVTATTSATRSVEKKEDVLESRASIIEDVVKAIADDKVCVVGVYGPGGVGKSKLLDDVEKRIREQKLFDVVAKANISRNPDLKRIQGEIAYALGLKLMNEETARGRADLLYNRLESDIDPKESDFEKSDPKKKILIILDDLWEKLELKEVGIPCGDDNKVRGCKLLLTSRYRNVLQIDMGFDREFQLKELGHGEARSLFERIVGDRANNYEFKPLVDKVVENCGGLPLLIVSLAKRLKHEDLPAWKNALTSIEGLEVKSLVEQNYEDLKDERIRELFLFCALKCGITNLSESLICCMGLGIFKKFSKTLENAKNRLIMDVQSLQDYSLLLDSCGMSFFKMHDIFVDVALSIASTKWNALVGRNDSGFKQWSKDELRHCTMMSSFFVGIDELPEKLDCPNLRMLLLYENNPSLKISDSFFESTEKLQVLGFAGLSFTSLPSSIEFLANLKSLILGYCHLADVTVLGKLKELQFLSITKSAIAQLPKEIGELTELRYLGLTGCNGLKVIDPGVLESLVNLEELYMEDSFDQWEAEDKAPRSNASLAELKKMKKLSTLYIAIPHSAILPRDLPFGKLNEHKIQIGAVWDWLAKYTESRTLKLKLDSGNLLRQDWVQKCLQRTQDLHLDALQDGNNSIHDLCIEGFQELKHLHVQNSSSFHYVVHSTMNVQCTAFTRLESLFLENLNNLEKICHGYLALESFSKLKIVKVDNCGEIKHLFPLSMMRILPQLEEIEISRCHLMQQIIAYCEADEDGDGIYDDPIVKSCNLRRLALKNLPEMTRFCKTADHSVDFFDGQQLIKLQSLEAIIIKGCPLIREVFGLEGLTASGEVEILSRLRELILSDLPSLRCIWDSNLQRTLCFRNLRALKVQNCENLRFLFSSSMAEAFGQINEIKIASCKLLEEIINVQEEELEEATTADTLEFPLLTSLSFEELPNLRTFSYGKYRIYCPSLTRLTISRCPKMMTFSSFDGTQQSMTANTGLQQTFGCFNSSLSLLGFFNEKVLFPSLEELKLSSMCQLKRIWHNQLHGQSFCKLTSLTVELCENLSHVFPSNSVVRLQSLNKIEVVGCPSLEALFELVSLSPEKRQKPLVLSALNQMKLLNLPSLRDILKSECKVTLAFPSLMEVNVRCCPSLPYLFSSAMAKTLDKLAVLDVSCCNNLWGIIAMENGEGNSVETFKFPHLSTLKLVDLEKLISFRSASCAGDGLHPLFDEKLAFPKLQELHIKGIQQKELWNEKILMESFCRLKVLKVKQCHNLMNVIPSFMWKRLLHYIEYLTVESCNLIEGIFMLEGLDVMEREVARSNPLRELILYDLPSLTYIWKNEDLLNLCLHNLTTVGVETCPHLRNLFTMSMAKSLGQLQYLRLCNCVEMEYIVAKEEEKLEEAADVIVIPKLINLHVNKMPKLKSFCHGKHILQWPSLKWIIVEGCNVVEVINGDASCRKLEGSVPKQQPLLLVEKVSLPWLESLTLLKLPKLKEIWNSQFPPDVNNLNSLRVEDCAFLLSIIPSNLLIKLQNLAFITVERCQLIREVFEMEGLTTSGDVEILSRLTTLTLSDLPSLECIWNKNPRRALCFRNLWTLKVHNCENLRFLFSSSMAKALSQLKVIEIASCKLMEEIMDMQQEESEEAATSDTLEFPLLTSLSLVELPNLRTFAYGKNCIDCPSLTNLTISGCSKMMIFSSFKGRQQSMTTDTGVQQAFGRINSSLPLPGFFNEMVLFPSLEELKLSSMCQLKRIWHNQLRGQSFCKLASLNVELCENLSHVFPSNSVDRLQSLNKIEVVGCPSLEALFEPASLSSEKRQKPLVLSALKKLKLLNLPRLRDILKSDCKVTLAFPSLMEVNVRCCHSLPYLFSSATAKTLDKLAVLDVSYCNKMWGIIAIEEGKKTIETFKFHHLSILKLGDLENLISFSSESYASDGSHPLFDEKHAFPKLEELHVKGVQQKELWNDTILVESFCHLKVLKVKQCHNLMNVFPSFMWKRLLCCMESLTVEKCPRLRNLFTMSMAKSLGQLQYLGLGGCGEMEYMVAREEEKLEEAADRIVIPRLVTLYLHNMPKLRNFYQEKHISEWPSLKEFTVEDCKAVEVILGDANYRKQEGSVLTKQPLLLIEKVEFPSMELMKISHMDNVVKIWLDELASTAFSKLKTLIVEYCPKLSSIFSSNSILIRFQNLEKLCVIDCDSLEVVFHIQELNMSGAHPTSTFQLRELYLERLPKLKDVWSGHSQGTLTFERLGCLKASQCQSLKSLFPSSVAKSMTQLEELVVYDCGVEEIIVEEDGGVGTSAGDLFFPRLTKLTLNELPKLGGFYSNNHTSTWPLLKQLLVKHCGKMRSLSFASETQSCQDCTTSENQPALFSFEKVFPRLESLTLTREDAATIPRHYTFVDLTWLYLECYHDENVAFPSDFLLQRFPNLQLLTVQCSSFEEIFPEDISSGHGGATPCEKPLKTLANLKEIGLYDLCNLRQVWKDGSLMVEILNQIRNLAIWRCPSLPIVLPSPTSFQSLTQLTVWDCAGLIHMGTCSAVASLVHLTQLFLRDCSKMEDVVADDGDGIEQISFPMLQVLVLDRLPSLESFSPSNCAFKFPSLARVVVKQCPKMNIFCKGALRTPILDKVFLSEETYECCWEGDLNTTIQFLSASSDPL